MILQHQLPNREESPFLEAQVDGFRFTVSVKPFVLAPIGPVPYIEWTAEGKFQE
jgi:hypothetical protein